jgi:hypothetical protein
MNPHVPNRKIRQCRGRPRASPYIGGIRTIADNHLIFTTDFADLGCVRYNGCFEGIVFILVF